ncbi:hypothetical protein M427DRAFT_76090 [Gonapodya prolifera JEL478]|uniref:Uncharacterized protein n=1 Tax=Gonapodya prolifera (strain JEL478) TaxID=1344416 RepID=A0A138ZWV0_GONPJ|nr:hypothetical protein M427DRAFT_76090 [Gonapodya prolifera JEL478]|eukprot:KXS08982.1 hypothetical protein M427DRAFT_76090 [Gonapodya prolifera JEL478]
MQAQFIRLSLNHTHTHTLPLLGTWAIPRSSSPSARRPPHISFSVPQFPEPKDGELGVSITGLILNVNVNAITGAVVVQDLTGDETKGWSGKLVSSRALHTGVVDGPELRDAWPSPRPKRAALTEESAGGECPAKRNILLSTQIAGDPSYRSPLSFLPLSFSLTPNSSAPNGFVLVLTDGDGKQATLEKAGVKTVEVGDGDGDE